MVVEPWKIGFVAVLVILSFVVYRRTFPPLSRGKCAALLALRIGSFALLGLLLVNPVLVSTRIEMTKPVILVLLDCSRSMGIRDEAGRTRLEAAEASLGSLRASLRAGPSVDVEMIPFASALAGSPVPRDSVVRAEGEGTDVWGALAAAQRRYRSRNVEAMVLLSDGRITRGMVTSGENIAVPVYAVGFGDTVEAADAAIEGVTYERIAYQGTVSPVEALIRSSGLKGRALDVRLLEDGAVKDRASITVSKSLEVMSVSLRYTPGEQGEHRLTVEVAPVAGEKQKENNLEQFTVEVLKNRIRVLSIDQFPDWNMTFLRDLGQRTKRLDVEEVAWVSGKGFVGGPDSRPWAFPAGPAGLAEYDLVIVSDDGALFDAPERCGSLTAYVEGGGSVLFLADEHSPLTRARSCALLRSVLPVQAARGPRVEYGEASVGISSQALDDPVASMLAEDGMLEALPPLPARIVGLFPSSAARVPLLLEDGGQSYPFLVSGRCGRGLTSVILGFPLWRWKLAGEEGRRLYESFFGGLIQYLAEGAKAPVITLDADRTVYRTGDRITLTAYVGEGRRPEGVRGEVRRKSARGDVAVSTVVFEPDARRQGRYRLQLEPLPPGEYVVTASEVTGSGGGLAGTASFSVVPVSVEFLKTSRDAAVLEEVAGETGGAYLEASRLAALASRLSFKEQRMERREAHELGRSIFVFVGIVAFLASEWILRKIWGLV